jgi:hypothetical protein
MPRTIKAPMTVTKLTEKHERITLTVKFPTSELRVSWSYSGTRVSGRGVTRELLRDVMRAATLRKGETYGTMARRVQSACQAAESAVQLSDLL